MGAVIIEITADAIATVIVTEVIGERIVIKKTRIDGVAAMVAPEGTDLVVTVVTEETAKPVDNTKEITTETIEVEGTVAAICKAIMVTDPLLRVRIGVLVDLLDEIREGGLAYLPVEKARIGAVQRAKILGHSRIVELVDDHLRNATIGQLEDREETPLVVLHQEGKAVVTIGALANLATAAKIVTKARLQTIAAEEIAVEAHLQTIVAEEPGIEVHL